MLGTKFIGNLKKTCECHVFCPAASSSRMLTFVAIIVTVCNDRCSVFMTLVHINSLFNSQLCLTKMLL